MKEISFQEEAKMKSYTHCSLQELSILQDIADMRGECKAHGNLGAVHLSLGNYINAMKCYQEQLERAQDIKDSAMEAQSQGNLGLTQDQLGATRRG
jgi:hypothetical protein